MNEMMLLDPAQFIPPSVSCYGKRYVKRWQASNTALGTYAYWRQLFFSAAVSRFEWEGIPRGIDMRYLEMVLCGWGAFAVTKRGDSPVAPYWGGRMTPIGNRDLYLNPNAIDILSPNGYQQRRHANYWVTSKGSNQHSKRSMVMPPDAVICWDNLVRQPILGYIDLQAKRLAEMDATVDQHSRALRVPYVFMVQEGGEKNAEEMYNRIMSGQPAIYTYQSSPANVPMQIAQTMQTSNYAGDKLLNDELKIVSATYTMLGVDSNAAAEKKERVQSAETLANNEQFLLQRKNFLRPRKEFCKAAKEILGWDIDVKWSVAHVAENEEGEQYADAHMV